MALRRPVGMMIARHPGMSTPGPWRTPSRLCLLLAPVAILACYAGVLAIPKTRTLGLNGLKENGPVEWATFALLLAAAVLGARLVRQAWRRESPIVCGFLTVFSAGVFFVALEEIAWGQWVFGFETPQVIMEHNRQGELTLHNLDGLHQYLHHLNATFGIGGLIGVALGGSRLLGKVAAPRILVLWFLTEALLGTAVIHVDAYTFNEQLSRCVRRLSELNELLIAGSALLYVRMVASSLAAGWSRQASLAVPSPCPVRSNNPTSLSTNLSKATSSTTFTRARVELAAPGRMTQPRRGRGQLPGGATETFVLVSSCPEPPPRH